MPAFAAICVDKEGTGTVHVRYRTCMETFPFQNFFSR